MDDIDRFVAVTAKALIDQHGISAAFVAARKADRRLGRGDIDGAAVWRRIAIEIERLQDPGLDAKH